MAARMKLAGLGDDTFPMPLTQQEIGDATGMTGIHVTRLAPVKLSPLERKQSAEARADNYRQMAAAITNPIARELLLGKAATWTAAAAAIAKTEYVAPPVHTPAVSCDSPSWPAG